MIKRFLKPAIGFFYFMLAGTIFLVAGINIASLVQSPYWLAAIPVVAAAGGTAFYLIKIAIERYGR